MSEMILWSPGTTLEQIEKEVIIKAYAHYKTKTATALALNISIRTLDGRLDKYREEEEAAKKREEERKQKQQADLMRARGNPPNNLGMPYYPTERMNNITNITAGEPAHDPFTAAERPKKKQ